MIKKSFALLFLLITTISYCQEATNSFPLELKGNRDVFQIVNEANKSVTLFVSDRKEVNAFLLNENMLIVDSTKTERPEKKYTDIAGYVNNNKNTRLYWTSDDHTEIYSQLYDQENHSVTNQEYELKLKDEKFIQNFSEDNLFYMVTIVKETNLLKFYIFDADGKMQEKTMDLTGFTFLGQDNRKTNLYTILREFKQALKASISLQKINPENTTSLTYSSNKRKCYLKNNQLTITLDLSIDFTQLIIIDLKTFTAKEKFIKNPYVFYENSSEVESNSFLLDDKLYQIKVSLSTLKLSIKSLNDELLKEYSINETDPIDFKNTEMLQKGTGKISAFSFDNNRILEKNKQFLRKLKNSSCAVSCYNLKDKILMTLGSVSDLNQGGMYVPVAIPGFGNGFAPSSLPTFQFKFINPTYDNFNSYKNRKVVYINCLLDQNNNHVSGEIKPIAFDKIQDFLSVDDKQDNLTLFVNPENKEKSKTVFKMDSNYYLGHYDNETKRYVIRKFTD